ncbi:MAG: peptidoglycan-binding protein [Pelosinus sp.]|nr:peptidoglycan-binding protein [Pelosinus sp.]
MKRILLIIALFTAMLSVSAIAYAAPGDKPLKAGMRGEDVQVLQRLLTDAGFYDGDIDGIFGNITASAVKDFQSMNNLPADGVAGNQTFLYLQRSGTASSRYSRSLIMSASAYSSEDPGNSNVTSSGNLLRKGLVAVDPDVIPLGTRLYIQGYGYALADDTGGAIKGNRLDLAFDTHYEAIQFGVRKVKVYILD